MCSVGLPFAADYIAAADDNHNRVRRSGIVVIWREWLTAIDIQLD